MHFYFNRMLNTKYVTTFQITRDETLLEEISNTTPLMCLIYLDIYLSIDICLSFYL